MGVVLSVQINWVFGVRDKEAGFVPINIYCTWIVLGLGSGSGFAQVLRKYFPSGPGQF